MLEMQTTAQQYWVNSVAYKKGEMAEIAVTDIHRDRYVAISIDDEITYRPLTTDELVAKAVQLKVTCDMTMNHYSVIGRIWQKHGKSIWLLRTAMPYSALLHS